MMLVVVVVVDCIVHTQPGHTVLFVSSIRIVFKFLISPRTTIPQCVLQQIHHCLMGCSSNTTDTYKTLFFFICLNERVATEHGQRNALECCYLCKVK